MARKPPKKKSPVKETRCWDCREDATGRLKDMFVNMVQKPRIAAGTKPARRAVFRKQHGIAYGRFRVNRKLPDELAQGIFAGRQYDCAVRFSSDTGPTDPDLKSTLGVGLKLFGVKGDKLIGEGDTADFIFQNMDRFFVKDAREMCEFTTAGVVDGNYPVYLAAHPEIARVLQAMEKEEPSCLTADYWAILPFRLGAHHIVKYRLVPDGNEPGAVFDDNDYLSLDLQRRLLNGPARFRFEVQLRKGNMPIDNARAVWREDKSPFIAVGELVLPKQDICAVGQAEFGQNLSFNIWRTLPAHEPLGSIAEARKVVYQASADTRHQANGQQFTEPDRLNPPFDDTTGDDSDCITTAAIYPPIGVMRVGNSEDDYFIGPEVNNPPPETGKFAYRDRSGALKRQAARFRIYGLNAAGKAVKELTLDNADITWTAHLANQKSSWYEFHIALDIPEAADAPPSMLRNNNVADRGRLLIDGGKQVISGGNKQDAKKYGFTGRFMDKPVYLGEMRTDDKGRLVMLGGHGKAANVNGDMAVTFANNEGWHDDISDGPVTAEVKYRGQSLPVQPAWVICAPPDFAPMQKSVRTMWDLMRSLAVDNGMLARPPRPSFTEDILPIFQRMHDLQWVNAGFAAAFGWGGQFDYTTDAWIAKLGDPSPAYYELRRTISNNFRRINVSGAEAAQLWPWIYGDAVAIPSAGSTRQNATLSDLQLAFLDQWVEGDFNADYKPRQKPPAGIDEVPIHEQPAMLTRAAMEFCLADAFHPGCEMTWPMRAPGMYMAPFRIKHAKATEPTNGHYYGPLMNADVISLPLGPLNGGQSAGSITRWMAIPWHCDTASCRDGYEPAFDPYLPTFWPARVPNNILGEAMYEITVDRKLPREQRRQSFARRKAWLDDLPVDEPVTYTKQINSMIHHFGDLAVVQERPGVRQDRDFPPRMQVGLSRADVVRSKDQPGVCLKTATEGSSLHGENRHGRVDLGGIDKANTFRRR